MIRRDILSWWMRPAFMQPWGKKQDTLFAGPWAGEFVWELLNWQAFLRWLAPQYKKVIVCCRESSRALYEDFAHEFVFHQLKGDAECNMLHNLQNPEEFDRIKQLIPDNADHLMPVGWQPDKRKSFIKFGSESAELKYDVIFHPRGRGFGTDRNWDSDKWTSLVKQLEDQGLKLACIGLKNATLDIPGQFDDFRDQPLDQTMTLLRSSRLVIGPSSGPMHLASLCGTPHLVWTDRKRWARGYTNRYKYESWWNVFSTPAIVLDEQGFDPTVDEVLHETHHFLAQ